jgi:hypothetical protein
MPTAAVWQRPLSLESQGESGRAMRRARKEMIRVPIIDADEQFDQHQRARQL